MKSKFASFTLALLLASALLAGCVGGEDLPAKRIHLMNPWDDATPQIHGENIGNWKKAAMVQEETCGWFVYEFKGTSLGLFRFLKGESWTIEYGTGGLDSGGNFNVDSLLVEADDIWIDTTSGDPAPQSTKPSVEGCGGEGVDTDAVPGGGDAEFPFPQQVDYGRGISPQFMDWTHVQAIYDVWRSEFWSEDGNMARIEFDDRNSATSEEAPQFTVSEGMGYGMLISVVMDNEDNDTRGDFDKLWNYYQNFTDANGLMHWKTSGFNSTEETGSASDGDLDVALALLIAYLQWGDSSYLEDAMALIDAIRVHEINSGGFLKPGDMWDAAKNPSYFSFVAFRYFAHFDSDNEAFWNNVVEVQYGLLDDAANTSTGLVPNWCDESGNATNPNNGYGPTFADFGFDAIRAPWRAGWDWLWFGDTRGSTFAAKIANWSDGKTGGTPSNLRPIYSLGGTADSSHNYTAQAAFTGAYGVACMSDADLQDYLDSLYAQLRNQIGEVSYYHTTLQVLYAALLTGNMPNYVDL